MRKFAVLALLVLLRPHAVAAHATGDEAGVGLGPVHTFTLDPLVLGPLTVFVAAYLAGLIRLWRRAGRGHGVSYWRAGCFAAAFLALLLALVWPLDTLGELSFAAHMAQHVVLITVAAPLLVLATPGIVCLWAFPPRWRARLGRAAARPHAALRAIERPLVAWGLFAGVLWTWHMPLLYETALEDGAVHLSEHLCLFVVALMLWRSVTLSLRDRAAGAVRSVLLLFATGVQGGLLGALLTFAPEPLYDPYQARAPLLGLGPLQDQQLAGVLMWIPGSFVYLAAALALAWRLLLRPPRTIGDRRPPVGTDGVEVGARDV